MNAIRSGAIQRMLLSNISQRGWSKRSLHESHGEARGERDVICLRNPTEDKRALWWMLMSADLFSLSRSVRRVGENPGNEVAPENCKKNCGVGLWCRENHPSVCVKIFFYRIIYSYLNRHIFKSYPWAGVFWQIPHCRDWQDDKCAGDGHAWN